MRTGNALMAVVAGLAISGCGLFDKSDPCTNADAASANITNKASACAGLSVPKVPAKSECETAIQNCNDAEKAVIEEEMNCLNGVGACVAGKEDTFLKDVATCAVPVAALSSACKKGFGL